MAGALNWGVVALVGACSLYAVLTTNQVYDALDDFRPVRQRALKKMLRAGGITQLAVAIALVQQGMWADVVVLVVMGLLLATRGDLITGAWLDRRFPTAQFDEPQGPELPGPPLVRPGSGFAKPIGPQTLDDWLEE